MKFALEKISLKNVDVSLKDNKRKIKLNTSIKALHFKGKFNEDNYTLISDGSAYVNLFQVQKLNEYLCSV